MDNSIIEAINLPLVLMGAAITIVLLNRRRKVQKYSPEDQRKEHEWWTWIAIVAASIMVFLGILFWITSRALNG
jgi:uncharacterized membrane protein YdcZ (DUF606 family)